MAALPSTPSPIKHSQSRVASDAIDIYTDDQLDQSFGDDAHNTQRHDEEGLTNEQLEIDDKSAADTAAAWQTLTPGYFARRETRLLDDSEDEDENGDQDDVEEDDEEDDIEEEREHDEDQHEEMFEQHVNEDEEDPFGSDNESEIDQDDSLQAEKLVVQRSLGQGRASGLFHVFRPLSHESDNSRTTAIHLDEPAPLSPRRHQSSFGGETLGAASHRGVSGNGDTDARKISSGTALSSMPDELEYYRSSIPHRYMRSPLAETPGSGNARTPSEAFTPLTPLTKKRQAQNQYKNLFDSRSTSALRASSEKNRERPVFRNPSSVRAMQLSSPSPPPSSVSRRRRLQQQGDPVQGTPSKHPDPRKEYPLVLLHCTVHPLPSFPDDIMREALSDEAGEDATDILRDSGLLAEKLSEKVIERGVLISHPGEDYELLEERVLESLELAIPRISECGHMAQDLNTTQDNENKPCDCANRTIHEDLGRSHCADCGRHLSHAISHACIDSIVGTLRSRRWDIRVYASNGLMRAGAWSAAWREMEKVDIEVGVWMSEATKRKVEAKISQHLREQQHQQGREVQHDDLHKDATLPRTMTHTRSTTTGSIDPFLSLQKTGSPIPTPGTPASKAACSRAPSMESHKNLLLMHRPPSPSSTQDHDPNHRRSTNQAQPHHRRSTSHQDHHDNHTNDQTPLSTLLHNYLARQLHASKDHILPLLILLVAVFLAANNLLPASSPSLPLIAKAHDAVVRASEPAASHVAQARESGRENAFPPFDALPLCAFPIKDVEADGRKMVAVEWDVVRKWGITADGRAGVVGDEMPNAQEPSLKSNSGANAGEDGAEGSGEVGEELVETDSSAAAAVEEKGEVSDAAGEEGDVSDTGREDVLEVLEVQV